MVLTLGRIAELVKARLEGDPEQVITGLGSIRSATAEQITFLADPRYRDSLATTNAAAVLCGESDVAHCKANALVVDNPHLAFARISHHFDPAPKQPTGVHPRAVVAEDARIDDSAHIGANAVVESGAVLEAGVVVMANSYVGADTYLGPHVTLWPNVTIYHGVTLGERCVVHANTVIGSDGFRYTQAQGQWHKVAQVGGVHVGSDVEIGSACTIDRGAINDTVIGNGVIIDNQVHLAHNVSLGDHTAIAGKVGVSGSTRIGAHCAFAGMVGITGHLEICDRVQVLGLSMVSRSIDKPGTYASTLPVDEQRKWRRNVARFRNLDDMYRRLVRIEKRLPGDQSGNGTPE
jgi:UDP-3-O-[3-hydroxymyristoyl] glucosamine N-acyltransferase